MISYCTAPDPFGRAVRDYYPGELEESLIDHDGDETREHSIEEWYFGEHQRDKWFELWLEGPLLDMSVDAGRDTLYFQEQFETTAIEVSEHLVETMQDRGVDDARLVDMSPLREHFGHSRSQSAFILGTQAQLAGSIRGLRQFSDDLALVITEDTTVILHGYTPELEVTKDIFVYREDPTPGLTYRIFHYEYDGEIGRILLFQLLSIDRLREATIGTSWETSKASYGHLGPEGESNTWLAVLTKV